MNKAYNTATALLLAAVFLTLYIKAAKASDLLGYQEPGAPVWLLLAAIVFAIIARELPGGGHLARAAIWLRRAVTMLPAFAVVAWGVDATRALVLSQVVLSVALPVPMLALLWFASRRAVMGEFAIGWPLRITAAAGAAIVLGLNGVLLFAAAGVPIPGFAM